MAPSRKSRSVNKRFSHMNEAASNKYEENANKTGQKKRKLCDMLVPQWTKEELENFYEAYRKYGKDWKKVASVVRHRSVEMVEALYSMNKAYLSLPEGVASVVGLIAILTDHYCILGRSDSEQENNEDAETSRKPQKHARSKLRSESSKELEGHIPDFSESHPMASTSDCLSPLKNRRSGIRPHAVKKRTPRVPVAYSNDQDNSRKYSPPARQGLKLNVDANNNDVAHEIALALTEASHRGGSPLVSWTPKRKAKGTTPSPVRNGERMRAESEMTNARLHGCEMDEGGCELSLGSTEADNDYYDRNEKYAMGREGTGTLEVQQRRKRYFVKKKEVDESKNEHVEDIKEACSGTEEGQKLGAIKGKLDTKDAKSARSFYKDTRKKSKKALVGGVVQMSNLIRIRKAVTTAQSLPLPAQLSAAIAPAQMDHLRVGPKVSHAPASSASSVAQPVSVRHRHCPPSTTDTTSTSATGASGSQPGAPSSSQSNSQVTALTAKVAELKTQMSHLLESLARFGIPIPHFSPS